MHIIIFTYAVSNSIVKKQYLVNSQKCLLPNTESIIIAFKNNVTSIYVLKTFLFILSMYCPTFSYILWFIFLFYLYVSNKYFIYHTQV